MKGDVTMKTVKTKLMGFIASLVLAICLGYCMLSSVAGTFAVGNTVDRDFKAVAEQAAQAVNLSLENEQNMLANMFAEAFTKQVQFESDEGVFILNQGAKKIKAVRVGLCGSKGHAVFSDGTRKDIMEEEVFQKAMAGETYISDPGPSILDGTMVVVIAVPLIMDHEVYGMVIEEMDPKKLSQLVNEKPMGETGAAFLINEEGTFIAHSDYSYVEKGFNPKTESKEKKLIRLVDKMLKRESGATRFEMNGQWLNAGYAPVEETSWVLAVTMEHDEVYQQLVRMFWQLGGITIVFIILATLIGAIVGKKFGNQFSFISYHLGKIAEGDLTGDVEGMVSAQKDEISQMTRAMLQMQGAVSSVVSTIQDNAYSLSDKSSELSNASEDISTLSATITNAIKEIAEGTSVQANELVNITGILEQFNEKLKTMGHEVKAVDEVSRKIDKMAVESGTELRAMSQSINEIQEAFVVFKNSIQSLGDNISEINNITNMITDVANQTNLLALNASIEAARAGEAGKGFAVVAKEIGSLAEQSKNSTNSITDLINEISGNTSQIVNDSNNMGNELTNQIHIINRSINTFQNIVNEIANIMPMIQKVKESGYAINSDKKIILCKIDELSSISQEISSSSEEISASTRDMNESIGNVADSARQLTGMTTGMLREVNKFVIKQENKEK